MTSKRVTDDEQYGITKFDFHFSLLFIGYLDRLLSVCRHSCAVPAGRQEGGNPPFDKLRVTLPVMVSLLNHGCPTENFGHDG
jgi:hypothetical protein